jgi:hypothetical protein
MTLPPGIEGQPDTGIREDVAPQAIPFTPVPVRVIDANTERVPPEFCSHMTWTIMETNMGPPTQIYPRSLKRYKGKAQVTFPNAGTLYMNNRPDPLSGPNPQGSSITVADASVVNLPDYDAMQPMYAVSSIGGVTVSVWDEQYGMVANQ